MIFKYVMIDHVLPVFFFDGIQHVQLEKIGVVTSAGWIEIKEGKEPVIVGASMSLPKKPPHPEDVYMISRFLNLNKEDHHASS